MSGTRIIDDATGDGVSVPAVTATAANAKPLLVFGAAGGPALYRCTGSPLSVIIAAVGSLAIRDDGGANTTLYVKEAGAGLSTGWVAK